MADTTENEVGLEEHDTTEEMETELNDKGANSNIPELIEIGDSLDAITPNPVLVNIAKTNQVNSPWQELQTILKDIIKKQCDAMQDKLHNEDVRNTVDTVKTNIIHIIEEHTNCPFTIQRLCELVNEPKKNYKMYIKYLRAVEKVLMVTSYWEDFVDVYNEPSTEDKAQGDRLLPSFVTGMELEPHNFDLASSEQAVQDEDEVIENNTESGLAEKKPEDDDDEEEEEEEKKEEEKETEEEKENEKEIEANVSEKIDEKDSNDESKMELDQKEDEL